MTRSRNLFLLSAFFVFAGVMHFVIPERYADIMPAWIPSPMMMVYLSGVLEMLGGLGVLLPQTRRWAGAGLIALLIGVFPANVQMLSNALADHASPVYIALLFLRLPLQPLMIVWIYRTAMRSARDNKAPRTIL
ncbi:MAG: DoxX family protein [Gemmatimonadales bacterium]